MGRHRKKKPHTKNMGPGGGLGRSIIRSKLAQAHSHVTQMKARHKLIHEKTGANANPNDAGVSEDGVSDEDAATTEEVSTTREKVNSHQIPASAMFCGASLKDMRKERLKNLQSVIATTDLEDIVEAAEFAGGEYSKQKINEVVLDTSAFFAPMAPSEVQKRAFQMNKELVVIPRRPPWNSSMSLDLFEHNEKLSFMEWRRSIARLEQDENVILTPFEKNIEVWRQLWRVVERSDLVVQIVDARSPLFFFCKDLNHYIAEVSPNKKTLLLLNKADLLNFEQRYYWASYFVKKGIDFVFWSSQLEDTLEECQQNDFADIETTEPFVDKSIKIMSKILRKEDLIKQFLRYSANEDNRPTVIGMVGFPNVGKSSTINVLLGEKKVAVALQPGLTKHLQTHNLSERLILCDCPGLLFPKFAWSKAHLVLNGVIPIDSLTDYLSPVSLICQMISKDILAKSYNLTISPPARHEDPNRAPFPEEVLGAYALSRGYTKLKGCPDLARASRYILKDFVKGNLCYVSPPPKVDSEVFSKLQKFELKKGMKVSKVKLLQSSSGQPSPNKNNEEEEIEVDSRNHASFAHTTGTRYKRQSNYTRTTYF